MGQKDRQTVMKWIKKMKEENGETCLRVTDPTQTGRQTVEMRSER